MNRRNFLIIILAFFIVICICIVKNSKISEQSIEYKNLVEKINNINNEEFQEKSELLNKCVDDYEVAQSNVNTNKIVIVEDKEFSIEELWIAIGNYATNDGVTIDLDFNEKDSNEKYKMKMKVNGSYEKIVKFCEDLENDSNLKFEIKMFKIEKSESEYTATFCVENIKIKG